MSAKEERLAIGMDILELMDEREDLPLPNCHRLTKTMQEYFVSEGFVDELKEEGRRWRPTADYWRNHLAEIRATMRKDRQKYFEFYREWHEFKGLWKFVTKKEYQTVLRRDHADIGTRALSHNDKLEDGEKKWVLNLPYIAEVPLLTN